MANPTLVYGGSTVTLAVPDSAATNDRQYDERRTDKRTLSGHLRTQRLSRGYVYHLAFSWDLVSTYEAVIALWETAIAAGGYPTFTWTGGPWSSATGGVLVAVTIGAHAAEKVDFTRVSWSLTLVETEPR